VVSAALVKTEVFDLDHKINGHWVAILAALLYSLTMQERNPPGWKLDYNTPNLPDPNHALI